MFWLLVFMRANTFVKCTFLKPFVVRPQALQLLKKKLWLMCFPVNFVKFLRILVIFRSLEISFLTCLKSSFKFISMDVLLQGFYIQILSHRPLGSLISVLLRWFFSKFSIPPLLLGPLPPLIKFSTLWESNS